MSLTRTVDDGMADLSLESPTTFRLVAAATATVASLALVALGVQLGTDGLGIGSDRNPASASASPAAAVVDLGRPRVAPDLSDTLLSLFPAALTTPAASGATTLSAGSGAAAPAPAPAPAPSEPAPAPAPEPAPTPLPEPLPSAPLPDPSPILAPLEPVVDTVTDGLGALGTALDPEPEPGDTASAEAPVDLLPTLTGLLGL